MKMSRTKDKLRGGGGKFNIYQYFEIKFVFSKLRIRINLNLKLASVNIANDYEFCKKTFNNQWAWNWKKSLKTYKIKI